MQGEYGAGRLTVQVDQTVSFGGNYLSIQGRIFSPETGHEVGTFARLAMRDRTGDLYVEHAFLQLNRSVQGSGFAEQFNRNLYDWYRRSGVVRVEVHANIDVGGYTWARAGFDFKNEIAARQFMDRARVKVDQALARTPPKGLTINQLRALDKYLRDMADGTEPTSAIRIAQFGRQPGQDGKDALWAGKWLMLRSDWLGSLPL